MSYRDMTVWIVCWNDNDAPLAETLSWSRNASIKKFLQASVEKDWRKAKRVHKVSVRQFALDIADER